MYLLTNVSKKVSVTLVKREKNSYDRDFISLPCNLFLSYQAQQFCIFWEARLLALPTSGELDRQKAWV